jgi:hypothetical protein
MMTEANTALPNAGDLVFQRRERLIVRGASREVFVLGFRHGSAGARAVAQGGVAGDLGAPKSCNRRIHVVVTVPGARNYRDGE